MENTAPVAVEDDAHPIQMTEEEEAACYYLTFLCNWDVRHETMH